MSRFQVDEFLQTFDFPNPSLSAERRYTTNVPGQSLYFMNSPFVRRQADLFVKRLLEETADAELVAEDGEEGNGRSGNGSNGNGANGDHDNGAAEGDDTDDTSVVFRDREMIEAAYPLLYSRDVTEPEIAAGLEFLEERRAAFLAEELAKLEDDSSDEAEADASEADAGAAGDDEAAEGAGANEDEDVRDEGDAGEDAPDDAAPDTPEHRASMQAWIQYARALFSVAEFRFVD